LPYQRKRASRSLPDCQESRLPSPSNKPGDYVITGKRPDPSETERNVEAALADVRDCVMAGHWTGRGALKTLAELGEMFGASSRWMLKLFYRTGHVAMSAERRRLLALRAADFLERIADDLDRKAALLRAQAAEKRAREEQLRLPLVVRGCHGVRGSRMHAT